jgi:regulator of replication initiation timing
MSSMPNPDQAVPVDVMIKRLEEANARAHERAARAGERFSEPERVAASHPSDQQKTSSVLDRRSPRVLPTSGLFVLLLAATIGVAAFVRQSSYFDSAKLIVARWALPLAQTTPQDVAPIAAPMPPELAQRLQTMARDLANVAQGIGQLKTSQEQTVRGNAALAEQLEQVKAALSQMTRDTAAVVEQLKATQEQAVRPTTTRARRKPVPNLPQDGEAVTLGR